MGCFQGSLLLKHTAAGGDGTNSEQRRLVPPNATWPTYQPRPEEKKLFHRLGWIKSHPSEAGKFCCGMTGWRWSTGGRGWMGKVWDERRGRDSFASGGRGRKRGIARVSGTRADARSGTLTSCLGRLAALRRERAGMLRWCAEVATVSGGGSPHTTTSYEVPLGPNSAIGGARSLEMPVQVATPLLPFRRGAWRSTSHRPCPPWLLPPCLHASMPPSLHASWTMDRAFPCKKLLGEPNMQQRQLEGATVLASLAAVATSARTTSNTFEYPKYSTSFLLHLF